MIQLQEKKLAQINGGRDLWWWVGCGAVGVGLVAATAAGGIGGIVLASIGAERCIDDIIHDLAS